MAAGEQDRIALIEVLDRDGHARLAVPVTQWPVLIGRAIDCDVVLDDPHVAPHHLSLRGDEAGLRLEVGDSHNGVHIDKRHLVRGDMAPIVQSTAMQLGTTRLRLRLAGEPVPAELPMEVERVLPWWRLMLLAAGVLAWLLGREWLESDPGEAAIEYVSVLWTVPIGLAVWAGVCALASKLFRHQFAYVPHLGVALKWMLLMLVTELVTHMLAFMFGWSWASRGNLLVQAVLGAGWMYEHLALIDPARRRAMAYVVTGMFLAATIIGAALTYQREDRFFSELYMATLGPPALRLAGTQPAAQFFEEAAAMRSTLEERAKSSEKDAGAETAEAAEE